MGVHLVAYMKSITTKGTLQVITPIADSTVTINGNDLYVPDKYNMLAFAAGLTKGSQAFENAQLQAPSLREMFYPDLCRLNLGSGFNVADNVDDYGDSPIQLVTNEGLQFWSDGGGDGTTAQDAYGLIWFTDNKIAPATGKRFRIKATAAAALAAGQWVNEVIAFDQTLPVGNYDIIGMRAVGSGLVACRLVFIGASAVTRPGVPGCQTDQSPEFEKFTRGNMGVFGSFNSVTPPSVDFLGDTGTSQELYFDLVAK